MPEPDKLDKILAHLDAIHTKCDNFKTRLDAIEEEHKKDRTDAAEWKARADAEEKERKDKEAANAAMSRADANGGAIDVNAEKFAAAQMRADTAYQAWSKHAPHALHGESLRDFQIRLLRPLQQHSKVYKDSALNLVGDDSAFSVIENAIINDAVEASSTTFTMGAPLREIVTTSEAGHRFRKFVGDAGVAWATFMGGATKFGKINRSPGK